MSLELSDLLGKNKTNGLSLDLLKDFTAKYEAYPKLNAKTDWINLEDCMVLDIESFFHNSSVRCIQTYLIKEKEVTFFVWGKIDDDDYLKMHEELAKSGIVLSVRLCNSEKELIEGFFNFVKTYPRHILGHNVSHFDLGLLGMKKKKYDIEGIKFNAYSVGSGRGEAKMAFSYEVGDDKFLIVDTLRIAFTLFIPAKLADLSVAAGSNFPKKEIDYKVFEKEELAYDSVIYSIYDVLSVPDVYNYLKKMIYHISQKLVIEQKPSALCVEHLWMKGSGSLAEAYMNNLIDNKRTPPDFLTTYFGGLTRVWKSELVQEQDDKRIRYLDLKSAYPFAVLHQSILDILNGDYEYVRGRDGLEFYNEMIYSSTIIIEALNDCSILKEIERHKKEPMYGIGFIRSYNKEDRVQDFEHSFTLVKMQKRDRLIVTKAEWEMNIAAYPKLKHSVVLVEVQDGLRATSDKKSKEYMELFDERVIFQEEENPAEVGLKVLINAIYGKLAESKGKYFALALAASITSFVRQMVFKLAVRSWKMDIDVLYSDTDSLYLFGLMERIKDIVYYADELNPEPMKRGFHNLKDEEEEIIAFWAIKRKRYVKVRDHLLERRLLIDKLNKKIASVGRSPRAVSLIKKLTELLKDKSRNVVHVTGKNGHSDVGWRDILFRLSCICGGSCNLNEIREKIENADFEFKIPNVNVKKRKRLKGFVELTTGDRNKLLEWFQSQLTRNRIPKQLINQYNNRPNIEVFDENVDKDKTYEENRYGLQKLFKRPPLKKKRRISRSKVRDNPIMQEALKKQIARLYPDAEVEEIYDLVDCSLEYNEALENLKEQLPHFEKTDEDLVADYKHGLTLQDLTLSDFEKLCYNVYSDHLGQDIREVLPVHQKSKITRMFSVHFKSKVGYADGVYYFYLRKAWEKETRNEIYPGCFFEISREKKFDFPNPDKINWDLEYGIYYEEPDKIPVISSRKMMSILYREIKCDTIRFMARDGINLKKFSIKDKRKITKSVFQFPHRGQVNANDIYGYALFIPTHTPKDFQSEAKKWKEGKDGKTKFLPKEKEVYANTHLFVRPIGTLIMSARVNKVRMFVKKPNVFTLYRFMVDYSTYLQDLLEHLLKEQKIGFTELPRFSFVSQIDIEDSVDEKFAREMYMESWGKSHLHHKTVGSFQQWDITNYLSLTCYNKKQSAKSKVKNFIMEEWEKEHFIEEGEEEDWRSELKLKIKRNFYESLTYAFVLNNIKHSGFQQYIRNEHVKYKSGMQEILLDSKVSGYAHFTRQRAELFFPYEKYTKQSDFTQEIQAEILHFNSQEMSKWVVKNDPPSKYVDSLHDALGLYDSGNASLNLSEKNSAKSEKEFAAEKNNLPGAAGPLAPLEGRGLVRQHPPPTSKNGKGSKLGLIRWEWKPDEDVKDLFCKKCKISLSWDDSKGWYCKKCNSNGVSIAAKLVDEDMKSIFYKW